MKYILGFLFATNLSTCFAQVVFQKVFGSQQSNVAEFVNDAAIDPWGNMYIVGTNVLKTFEIAKVDSFGVTLWIKSLSTLNLEPNGIVLTTDSNLVLTGRTSAGNSNNFIFISKMDTASNILWSRYLPTDSIFNKVQFIFEAEGGNLIIGGYQLIEFDSLLLDYKYNPFLAKFDQNGNIMWFKQISGIYTSAFNNGIVMENGKYLMIGFAGDTLLGDKDVLITEIDTAGIILRSMVIGNNSVDIGQKIIQHNSVIILACTDNNLSNLSTVHFVQLDSLWNITQNRKNYTNGNLSTYNIIPYNSNSFLVSANGPMHYVIDSTLKIIKGLNYGNSGFNRRLYKSFEIGQGRVFSVGVNGATTDILVLRTDSALSTGCNSFTTVLFDDTIPELFTQLISMIDVDKSFIVYNYDSISTYSWNEIVFCNTYTNLYENSQNYSFNLNTYPNPAIDFLNVQFNSPILADEIYFEIIDLLGKQLAKFKVKESSKNTVTFDIQFLNNGYYILKCYANENVSYSKFLLSKLN